MYIITYKGKVVPLEVLYRVEQRQPHYSENQAVLNGCLSAQKKQDAIDLYLYYFGFTWRERAGGIDVTKY